MGKLTGCVSPPSIFCSQIPKVLPHIITLLLNPAPHPSRIPNTPCRGPDLGGLSCFFLHLGMGKFITQAGIFR